MIDAFKQVDTEKKLVIAGNANYDSPFHQKIRNNGDPRVVFIGWINDQRILKEIFCNAYACLHGHSVGGTNPALLMALGFSCMILALNTPYNSEVLENGKYGILFDKDAEDLGNKIQFIQDNPDKAHNYRQITPKRVIEKYNWDNITSANILTGYKKFIEGGPILGIAMIGDQLAFDFKKYERVPQERSSTNDSRYNRVNCSECKGEGFDLRFGKKGQCPCCGGKGYYLTDINTKDPIEFLTSYHRWTKSQELRRQADEQLAQNLDSGTQTFWMEYDPVTPRKRIIEHFPRTDDALNLPEGSVIAAESWNIDIETLQKNFARQDDLAQEVA